MSVPTLTLTSRAGTLEATFAPSAGMVGCSLRHRGAELLGQRDGLRAYVEQGATMASRSCTRGRTAGGPQLPIVASGGSYRAASSITVTDGP